MEDFVILRSLSEACLPPGRTLPTPALHWSARCMKFWRQKLDVRNKAQQTSLQWARTQQLLRIGLQLVACATIIVEGSLKVVHAGTGDAAGQVGRHGTLGIVDLCDDFSHAQHYWKLTGLVQILLPAQSSSMLSHPS